MLIMLIYVGNNFKKVLLEGNMTTGNLWNICMEIYSDLHTAVTAVYMWIQAHVSAVFSVWCESCRIL
jgi:hypothetical protein